LGFAEIPMMNEQAENRLNIFHDFLSAGVEMSA